MKTPHRITLVYGETVAEYDPITDQYIEGKLKAKKVPCLINFVTQERIHEMYGDRDQRVMVCRFNQAQEPFQRAIYQGATYKPVEVLDAPIKGAVRLVEVTGHGARRD